MSTQEISGFRDLTGLVKLLKVALGALALVYIVSACSSWLQIGLLEQAQRGNEVAEEAVTASDAREYLVRVIRLSAYLATAILFLRWTYLVKKNVTALSAGASRQTISPGWSVGYYFIPILNLWKPYQALKEAFEGSHSEVQYNWNWAPRPGLLPVWWTLWVTSTVVVNATFSALSHEGHTIAARLAVSWAQLLSVLINVPLIVVVWVLISTMQDWQTAKSKVSERA